MHDGRGVGGETRPGQRAVLEGERRDGDADQPVRGVRAPEGRRGVEHGVAYVSDDHVGYGGGLVGRDVVQQGDDRVTVPARRLQGLEDQDDGGVPRFALVAEIPQGAPMHRLAGQVGGTDERGVDLPDRTALAASSSATSPEASSAETAKPGPARSSWVLIRFATRFGRVPTTPSAVMGGTNASRASSADSGVVPSPACSSQCGTRQRAPARATSGSTPMPTTTIVRSRGRDTDLTASRAASSTRS